MKSILLISFVLLWSSVFSQMRGTFNQYMLNTGFINPAYVDIQTRYGGAISYRKQWMSVDETPSTIAANGFYRFSENQSVGMVINKDRLSGINTFDLGFSYAYHLWLTRKLALGVGVKAGIQQRSIQSDYVYFSAQEPTLDRRSSFGVNVGTGITLQSDNFTLGVSLPYVFNNALSEKAIYSTENNHFYANIGYKLRFSDNFVLLPSMLFKGVSGSPISMSFDGHVLIKQLVWFGGGYRSDNTVSITAGIFLPKGVRIVYSYEDAHFSPHKRFDLTHEITINYARSINDSPFSHRLYRKKNGKLRKDPNPFNR